MKRKIMPPTCFWFGHSIGKCDPFYIRDHFYNFDGKYNLFHLKKKTLKEFLEKNMINIKKELDMGCNLE